LNDDPKDHFNLYDVLMQKHINSSIGLLLVGMTSILAILDFAISAVHISLPTIFIGAIHKGEHLLITVERIGLLASWGKGDPSTYQGYLYIFKIENLSFVKSAI